MTIRFSEEFLAPYRARRDPFRSLMARAVFKTHYTRPTDRDFTDSVTRVVTSNVALDPNVTQAEAEDLFDCIWNLRGQPSGRGWWASGAPGIDGEALQNCWACEIRSIDDWVWAGKVLMLGGGVGFSLRAIDRLPTPRKEPDPFGLYTLSIHCKANHPDLTEVNPDDRQTGPTHLVHDSREGWMRAFRAVLEAAFAGQSLTVNVSGVRPRGAPLVTFGGTASGPGPLVNLLRSVWAIVRGAAGRKLTSVECLDVCNHIGLCIVAGAKRRSAIIALGAPQDVPFRRAKHDIAALTSHRYTSNNSIMPATQAELDAIDWQSLADDVQTWGEPGIVNLYECRKDDPHVVGVNPCFASGTLIHTRTGHFPIESLIGKEVEVWDGQAWRLVSTFQQTGSNQPMLKITMQDGSSMRVTPYHKMVLAGQREMVDADDVGPGDKLESARVPGDDRAFESGYDVVAGVEQDGVDEAVYCLVTEDPDRIALTNGLLVGRCGEITLEHRESCCLAEVFPTLCSGIEEVADTVRLMARFALRQRMIPLSDPIAEAIRRHNMRFGLSLSGIAEWGDATSENLYSLYKCIRAEADRYADDLGVNSPVKVTTVKPSGTIALLANCSPGVHSRYAPYYVRNVRFDKDDPIVAALRAAGVPIEPVSNSERLVVASFVDKAPDGATTNATETVRSQLERQLHLQRAWADNSVSATITFHDHERPQLAAIMAEFVPQLKSTSFLPYHHGYGQAPYVPISKEEYEDRAAAIDESADLNVTAGEDAPDFGGCAGGSCPVR